MSVRGSAGPQTRKSGGPRKVRRSVSIHAPTYAENDEPQPHPPVAFGFLNVNPEPCIDVV